MLDSVLVRRINLLVAFVILIVLSPVSSYLRKPIRPLMKSERASAAVVIANKASNTNTILGAQILSSKSKLSIVFLRLR